MSKIKDILSTSHLRILYQSLIEPYLTYSCTKWASPGKKRLMLRFYINFKNGQLYSLSMLNAQPTLDSVTKYATTP